MFLSEADTDKGSLRQGDILTNIVFPLIRGDSILFLGTADLAQAHGPLRLRSEELRKAPAWTCQMPTRVGFAAVISQCCDLEPKHGKIPNPTIALARLVEPPLGARNDVERMTSLRANRYPFDSRDPGYLNLFHIPAHEVLEDKEWTVDFTQVLSIPATEFPGVMAQKILQMDDDHRIRFKMKLAASFGRFTPEEEASGHPWLTELPEGTTE